MASISAPEPRGATTAPGATPALSCDEIDDDEANPGTDADVGEAATRHHPDGYVAL